MSDQLSRTIRKIMQWKKTAGGILVTIAGALSTWGYGQWAHQDSRIANLESAQTQAFTTSEVDRATLNNLAKNFDDFRADYRQDSSDFRRALMIPRPHQTAMAGGSDSRQ